ncbi:MAG: BatD family protein [Anaerolineae bacterium]
MIRWIVIGLIGVLLVLQVLAQTRPFAEGSIDLDAPYVGQPLIYTLRIYAQDTIDNSTITEPPFTGFGRSQIMLDTSASVETIDGITYNVIEQNYIIYPIRAGDLRIEPFEIDLPETPFRSASTIYSNVVDVQVQAYPQPAPDSFVNAIGQFDIQASAEPTTLNAGEALTLSLTISGTGNFEQLLAPELPLPDNWRTFDARSQYQQETLRFGSKTFTWSILVEGNGAITMPTIAFSYFNPQSEQYETRMSAPITVTVIPTDADTINTNLPRPNHNRDSTPPPPLLSIEDKQTGTLSVWFWRMWAIPPLLTAVWLFISRHSTGKTQRTQRRHTARGSKLLREIKRDLATIQDQEPQQAYQELVTIILHYVEAKSGQAVDVAQFDSALAQVAPTQRDALRTCLDEALAGQYAPISRQDVRDLSRRMFRICQILEAEGKR